MTWHVELLTSRSILRLRHCTFKCQVYDFDFVYIDITIRCKILGGKIVEVPVISNARYVC